MVQKHFKFNLKNLAATYLERTKAMRKIPVNPTTSSKSVKNRASPGPENGMKLFQNYLCFPINTPHLSDLLEQISFFRKLHQKRALDNHVTLNHT